jgi:hypothetical protein
MSGSDVGRLSYLVFLISLAIARWLAPFIAIPSGHRNPLNLTRATIALAFYHRHPLADFQESFFTRQHPCFQGQASA